MFDTLAKLVFERRNIQHNLVGGGFAQQPMNAICIEFGAIQSMLQLIVEGNFSSGLQRGGNRYLKPIEKTNQRGLILKHRGVHGSRGVERLLQDETCNLALLIAEEQAQREDAFAVNLIEHAD